MTAINRFFLSPYPLIVAAVAYVGFFCVVIYMVWDDDHRPRRPK